jgi:hypothetical protein
MILSITAPNNTQRSKIQQFDTESNSITVLTNTQHKYTQNYDTQHNNT